MLSGPYEFYFVVNQLCLTVCYPMDCSLPGFPVLHYLLQFAQTHVHWVNDAIQPPHHLSPTSPPALNLSQHQVTFPISWLLTSGRQGIEASASVSASVLPMNIQDWFPLGLTDPLAVQGTRVFSSTTVQKHQSILWFSASFMVQLSHPYITAGKIITLDIWTFVGKVVSLLFNTLSRGIIAFLPRVKCLLISWLHSLSTVILEAKKIKSITVSIFTHLFAMKWWDWMLWSSFFKCWVLSHLFHSPLSPSSRGSLVLCFLSLGWCHFLIGCFIWFILFPHIMLYLGRNLHIPVSQHIQPSIWHMVEAKEIESWWLNEWVNETTSRFNEWLNDIINEQKRMNKDIERERKSTKEIRVKGVDS